MLECLKRLFAAKPKYRQVGEEKVISDRGELHLTVSMQVREHTDKEKLIRELGKSATQFKKTDLNEAIACLEQMNRLLDEVSTEYSIETYLRLPLFLQQAGRMDEAELLFERLYKTRSHPVQRSIVKEKWDLAKKREAKRLASHA
ncbi:hypothetical protein [uncultured Methylophaga sp.]|uniref:hypothetical protein n=1 Tax=uncultured Methylophaga sp. TaxID=285271 RepID=UPI0026126C17|nr:hypothetical protein [uncultured Methylophaga sp.]